MEYEGTLETKTRTIKRTHEENTIGDTLAMGTYNNHPPLGCLVLAAAQRRHAAVLVHDLDVDVLIRIHSNVQNCAAMRFITTRKSVSARLGDHKESHSSKSPPASR